MDATIDEKLSTFVELCKFIFGENILSILLFGSVARGEHKKDSDIDTAILFKGKGLDAYCLQGLQKLKKEIKDERKWRLNFVAFTEDEAFNLQVQQLLHATDIVKRIVTEAKVIYGEDILGRIPLIDDVRVSALGNMAGRRNIRRWDVILEFDPDADSAKLRNWVNVAIEEMYYVVRCAMSYMGFDIVNKDELCEAIEKHFPDFEKKSMLKEAREFQKGLAFPEHDKDELVSYLWKYLAFTEEFVGFFLEKALRKENIM